MNFALLLGRILFAFIFVMSGLSHFNSASIGYAASQGVPLASLAVPVAGVLATLGGLSIALGYKARIGAWLLVVFLVPVTLMMHRFWAIPDAQMALMQQIMFLKNVALVGGALAFAYFGSGPLSVDARARNPNTAAAVAAR